MQFLNNNKILKSKNVSTYWFFYIRNSRKKKMSSINLNLKNKELTVKDKNSSKEGTNLE